jgi:multidrug resistance efflux pump
MVMHKRTTAVACWLLLALPMAPLSAQEFGKGSSQSGEFARIRHAVVSLKDFLQVPAMQAGVLRKLELADGTVIKEGVMISKDQQLGKLDDRDAVARQRAAQLDYEVAKGEGEKASLAIRAADKTVEVAAVEVEETRRVNARSPGAIPKTQERRQVLTHERSYIEAEVARYDAKGAEKTAELRQAQVDVASLNLDHHQIRSPIDGEVVQVYRKIGEWVSPGDPILRIIDLQTLRVEGFLKIDDYLRQDIKGQPVVVEIQLPRGRTETFESTITYVSPLVQASGDFRVVCEVKNRKSDGFWVMLPGMDAELTIRVKQSQLASAP